MPIATSEKITARSAFLRSSAPTFGPIFCSCRIFGLSSGKVCWRAVLILSPMTVPSPCVSVRRRIVFSFPYALISDRWKPALSIIERIFPISAGCRNWMIISVPPRKSMPKWSPLMTGEIKPRRTMVPEMAYHIFRLPMKSIVVLPKNRISMLLEDGSAEADVGSAFDQEVDNDPAHHDGAEHARDEADH